MMEAIVNAADTVVAMMGKVFEIMTGNPFLTTLRAVSLISVGVSVFAMIRNATR